jgi:hypothetical protein
VCRQGIHSASINDGSPRKSRKGVRAEWPLVKAQQIRIFLENPNNSANADHGISLKLPMIPSVRMTGYPGGFQSQRKKRFFDLFYKWLSCKDLFLY